MKPLEVSVVTSMDGKDAEIYSFLPYILQDFWELGSSPETIVSLIRKHIDNPASLKVLDAGCGKGAVSISIANTFGCNCLGIDAVKEFIDYARDKARINNVEPICKFQQGDLRLMLPSIKGFDVIILGSVGNFLDDYTESLSMLKSSLSDTGIIIMDDAYIDDEKDFSHPAILKKSELISCIDKAGLRIKDEYVYPNDFSDQYNSEFDLLESRCRELIQKHPDKSKLFLDYIDNQKREYDVLKSIVINSCLVLKTL